jgi:hypothetical protein
MAGGTDGTESLADALHLELCGDGMAEKCGRYARQKEAGAGSHWEFYGRVAEGLFTRLEPLIGSANVLPVVRIVFEEIG